MFTAKLLSSDGVITAAVKGQVFTVDKSHPKYATLRLAYISDDSDLFLENVNVVTAVQSAIRKYNVEGSIEVVDGEVLYNGRVIHNVETERILQHVRQGLDFAPMAKFLENLMANPSAKSVEALYLFLEHKHLPITEDGCFLAYKTVQSNYYSHAGGRLTLLKGRANSQGQIYNGVGEVIECLRNEVDDNHDNHCSKGLHVGALSYAGPGGWYHHSGDKVVIVKVNPRDAVSVPTDHSFTKLRTCRYEVLADYSQPLTKAQYSGSVGNEYQHEEDDAWDAFDDSWDESVDVDEMYEGGSYEFDYTDRYGVTEHRYAYVDKDGGDYFYTELLFPEEDAGETRMMYKNKIANVKELF